jgi:hypothetical protein
MLRAARAGVVGVVGAVVALAALAGCKGPPEPRQDDVTAADDVPPEPPPDLSLGDGYSLGRPIVDGHVALVPVYAAAPPSVSYVALTDAMRDGTVIVSERVGGYDGVRVENRSERQVFAMSGELIFDAHQDRTIAENVIIPPGETREVAVRCVEAGRSYGSSEQFTPAGLIAEPAIRRRIRYKDQSEVWNQVNLINSRLGLTPQTSTYRYAAQKQLDGDAKARRDRLVAQLARVPGRDHVVGLGLAVDGVMIALDRFATPALYQSIETRLVASYLPAEADGDEVQVGVPHPLNPSDVRRLARRDYRSSSDANDEFLRPLDERTDERD